MSCCDQCVAECDCSCDEGCNCECDCECDCNCHDDSICEIPPRQLPVAIDPNPRNVFVTGKNYTVDVRVNEVQWVGGVGGQIRLPLNPQQGDRVAIVAVTNNVSVVGKVADDPCGCKGWPICGEDPKVVFKCTTTIFEFSAKCTWIPLQGGAFNALGTGEILVDKNIDIYNLDDKSLPDNVYARARRSADQPFELLKDSTTPADGITVLNALSTGAGLSGATALPGRWKRNETFSKRWSEAYLPANLPIGIQIDSLAGDDENDGLTPATALKTNAEACRRLHQAQAGRNYIFQNLNDVPDSDRWRPSFVLEPNQEDLSASGASAGYQQVFNATLRGKTTPILSSTLTGTGITITTAGAQATLQDASLGAAGITANLGRMIVLTDGPDAGASAFIGAGPNEDPTLPANTARISALVRQDGTNPGNQAAGVTYQIVDLTKWAPASTQLGSSGRYAFQFLDVTPVNAQPANQNITTFRFSTIAINFCRWQRVLDLSTQHFSSQGSAFTFSSAQAAAGANRMTINALGVAAFLNGLFLNVDCVVVKTSDITVINQYLERSWIQTFVPNFFVNYGFFQVFNGVCHGAYVKVLGAQGLSIYNWGEAGNPTKAGILLSDGSLGRFSSLVRGTDARANTIGVLVRNNSKLLIAGTALGASMATDGISGTLARVRIFNPTTGGNQNLATAITDAGAGNPMTVAGAVTFEAAAFSTWAELVAAPFKGFAFSQFDQSAIAVEQS